jgi:hypothetical protein
MSGKSGSRTRKATFAARLFSGQVPSPIGWPFHERSMKDSNLRTGRPMYALAGRCRSRWANAP